MSFQIPNRGSRPPSLMSPTTPTTVTSPSTHSYRLDRVPEDEWIEDYYEDYVSEDDMVSNITNLFFKWRTNQKAGSFSFFIYNFNDSTN